MEEKEEKGEEKEEKKEFPPAVIDEQREFNPGEELAEAFTQLQGVPLFDDGEFNTNSIIQLFLEGTTDPTQGFLDKTNSIEIFEREIKKVIRTALRSDNPPAQIRSIFQTLGKASQKIDDQTGESPIELIEAIIQEEFPIFRIKQLEGKITQPVDIPGLINTLFVTDLQNLQRRSLGANEIAAIRAEFQQDLKVFEEQIITSNELEIEARELNIPGRADKPFTLFGQNTFRMLQDYINDHVENDQLRALLLGDIQQSIAANRQKLGIQLGDSPPQITPISANRVSILRPSAAESIANIIGESLVTINQAQARIERSKKRRLATNQMKTQKVRVLEVVKTFNDFVQRNQIRSAQTGELQIIPTEVIDIVPQTVEDSSRASKRIEKIRPAFITELITQLNNLSTIFASDTQSFEYVPVRIRDVQSGQTREGIIRDIVNMQRRLKIMGQKRLRGRKGLTSSVSRRATFPNIDVLRARRRRQQLQGKNVESFGAHMREIRIKKDVTLAELAKIANMIAMENGSLETINENPLLDVQKGVTTIQDILAAIMSQQKTHSGNDFSLIFVPANVFGGMFLDGSLDVIHKNRMLVSPVGGDIFSSIFSSIGNVAKTVASFPLQAAGAVFGGELQPLVKPLFDFNAPIARRKDAPQTGGIISPDTFIQGEQQPEPFINRSQNQQFHIQPFPFGGRIDNTGFIDQSQVNPKFAWANTPMISLTAFG